VVPLYSEPRERPQQIGFASMVREMLDRLAD
jgi:hypothetical protein